MCEFTFKNNFSPSLKNTFEMKKKSSKRTLYVVQTPEGIFAQTPPLAPISSGHSSPPGRLLRVFNADRDTRELTQFYF